MDTDGWDPNLKVYRRFVHSFDLELYSLVCD